MTQATDELDERAIRATVEWMSYLKDHGAHVARPLRSTRGRLTEVIEHNANDFVVTAFEGAKGMLAEELPRGAWDEELCRSLGSAVGTMHGLSKQYVPPSEVLTRPRWDSSGNCFNPTGLSAAPQSIISDRRAEVLRHISSLPTDVDSYGLIHADLHCANFFVDVETRQITLFDFDDCCYGWYVMDVAMGLFDMVVLYGADGKRDHAAWFLKNYLHGYVRKKRLGAFWVSQLPHFLKLLEIGVYLQVAQLYGSGTDDPWILKFMPGRRERLEAGVPFLDLQFERFASDSEASGTADKGGAPPT
jgi:Ser/Thr protein kinase RdoA (MazF antagonist)